MCSIFVYCTLGAFTSYQDFTSSALSAETVAIMAHNNGLELGADMVLLLRRGGEGGTEIMLELCWSFCF